MELESSFLCSQEPVTGRYPEAGESFSAQLPTLFLEDPF
jgi:hypothetical protein